MASATPPTAQLETYVAAIARRNVAWAAYQEARRAWLAGGGLTGDPLSRLNAAQDDYEWAARELVRERVILRASR